MLVRCIGRCVLLLLMHCAQQAPAPQGEAQTCGVVKCSAYDYGRLVLMQLFLNHSNKGFMIQVPCLNACLETVNACAVFIVYMV